MSNTINLIDFCIFHHDGGHGWLETTKEVIDLIDFEENEYDMVLKFKENKNA